MRKCVRMPASRPTKRMHGRSSQTPPDPFTAASTISKSSAFPRHFSVGIVIAVSIERRNRIAGSALGCSPLRQSLNEFVTFFFLVIVALAAVAVVLGYQFYRSRQNTAGVEVNIGERGISIGKSRRHFAGAPAPGNVTGNLQILQSDYKGLAPPSRGIRVGALTLRFGGGSERFAQCNQLGAGTLCASIHSLLSGGCLMQISADTRMPCFLVVR